MNERQLISIVIGVFGVLLMLLAWSTLYPSAGYDLVAQGVAGAIMFIGFFAVVVGFIVLLTGGRN